MNEATTATADAEVTQATMEEQSKSASTGNDGADDANVVAATVDEKKEPEHEESAVNPTDLKEKSVSNDQETPAANEATTLSPGADGPSGKGAQILFNRFNSLKERANQNAQTFWSSSPGLQNNAKVVQETAQTFWKQTPKLPVNVSSLRSSFGINANATPGATEPEDASKEASEKEVQQESTDSETPAEVKPNQFSLVGDDKDVDMGDRQQTEPADDEDQEEVTSDPVDNGSRMRVGKALSKASIVASVAYESVVANGFRGRYNNDSKADEYSSDEEDDESDDEITSSKPVPESQTEKILKSRIGQHMQQILDELDDHEYAMLLGRGMLGVNLKQCYLKNHGVYIDFLVPDGQAALSGVVRSGDLPVRLGEIDLRKSTIYDVPAHISSARRPIVLVLATGTKVAPERIDYIDVVVAMMHRAREYYTKRGTLSNLPSASSPTAAKDESEPAPAIDIQSVTEVEIPAAQSIQNYLTPAQPTLQVRGEFLEETAYRSLDKFVVEGLCQVQDMDKNFREATRNAFLTCALDTRRLTFLSRHFSGEDELPEGTDDGGRMTPSAQLMLFLELTSFLDLYHVTTQERLREMANRIAYKFFLPTKVGNKLQPPLFDFHQIVPDASLRRLESVLADKNMTIPKDTFFDFSQAVVDSLIGPPFMSFLASIECARMRAYLRDTAPFMNLPLHEVVDGVVAEAQDAGAKNTIAYILLFLICQQEKPAAGEYSFAKEEENNRVLGAANDLCCALFLRKTFIPTLKTALSQLAELKDDQGIIKDLVDVCEKLWNTFIITNTEASSKSNDVTASYQAMKEELEEVASRVQKVDDEVAMTRSTAESILKSELAKKASKLADDLIFNFADNVNSKFREHKFHEWLCNEMCKVRADDPNWESIQAIPHLPQGCVKRLLRKAELPEGVSSHKPFKTPEVVVDDRNYPNADYAVVFGSSVGPDLAAQMPIPGNETSDIRRYTCLPVALDREDDIDSFSTEEVLPPTFESYVVVPARQANPFSRCFDEVRTSQDGWDVSLVSFTIPNAESSGADSSLFGVSLFLQRRPGVPFVVDGAVDAFAPNEASPTVPVSSSNEFESPIQLEKAEGDTVKTVKTSSPMPVFNEKLKGTSWVTRVQGDESRDTKHSISIGLALVSKKNVMLAMHSTLSRLLFDYSGTVEGEEFPRLLNCGVLANVLGNFAHRDVEHISLKCILEPYLQVASSPWVDKPIFEQAEAFERLALRQITDSLPPIPLALMYIAALLEQKIVLSSSRRSVLHAATVTLKALLHPLEWSHLMVPMVPSSLAGDLIQYPAPFILGVPSEDAKNAELIGNLPRGVTLVDLDVGRVILAPEFGYENEMVQKAEDPEATAKALRTQVLYLAQTLGGVFGYTLKPESWLCDYALPIAQQAAFTSKRSGIEGLKRSTTKFVKEMLKGIESCCYWVEEATSTNGSKMEPTVLFDEDKFFDIKSSRANQSYQTLFPGEAGSQLALSLNSFDLVLESFLRCQSVSTYISSRAKEDMIYS